MPCHFNPSYFIIHFYLLLLKCSNVRCSFCRPLNRWPKSKPKMGAKGQTMAFQFNYLPRSTRKCCWTTQKSSGIFSGKVPFWRFIFCNCLATNVSQTKAQNEKLAWKSWHNRIRRGGGGVRGTMARHSEWMSPRGTAFWERNKGQIWHEGMVDELKQWRRRAKTNCANDFLFFEKFGQNYEQIFPQMQHFWKTLRDLTKIN